MHAADYTILNVDDSEGGRYSTTRILTKAGFRVLEAGSGSEALAHLEQDSPDLVLLDINLPDISGFELCRQIKDRFGSALPVLHVSATYVMSSEWVDSGDADGFLVQPVEPAALIGNVRSLLRAHQAEQTLRRQERELQALAEAIDRPVAVLDADRRIRLANSAFLALLGPLAPGVGGVLELKAADQADSGVDGQLSALAEAAASCNVRLAAGGEARFSVRPVRSEPPTDSFLLLACN